MKKKVIAYLHTHWDREWYRSKEEFNLRLVEVFDEVLDELKNNKAPSFYFDGQTAALEDYLKYRPNKLNLIKKFIKEKKLFIGPFYVSSDSFLINSDLMEKNLELGINFSKKLGQNEFIGYFPDSFGHSKEITKLVKKFGIDKIIIWRGIADVKADFLMDNIKITRLPQGYFFDAFHNSYDISKKAEIIKNTLDKIAKFSSDTLLLPIGGDHLGIIKNATNEINKINQYLDDYEIILSNPFEYFNTVYYKELFNGEFLNNKETYILGGVYSFRIKEKIQNFELEHKLKKLEKFNVLEKNKYTKFLKHAEKELIKCHAHDSIYGCSIDSVNNAVKQRFQNVSDILNYIEKRIIYNKKTPKQNYIGLYNLNNDFSKKIIRFKSYKKIKNSQIIAITKGFPEDILYNTKQVPITEDFCTIYEQLVEVENFGQNKYSEIKPIKPIKKTKIGDGFIENEFLKIEISNKKICVLDKTNNKKYENFVEIINTKDIGDSYNSAPKDPTKIEILKTKVMESGDIRSKLRAYYKNFQLDLILYNNSKNLEFEFHINNKEKNHKLQILFNLKNNIQKTIAGDLYTNIERIHNPDYRLLDNMPPKAREEVKTNTFPFQKYVYAQNFAIFSFGQYEYEIYKNTISIALLRTSDIISNPKNPARFVPAGPPLNIPNAQEIGKIEEKIIVSFCSKEQLEEIFENNLENYIVRI